MIEVPTHAAERARERYGIELTFQDVLDFAKRCKRGEGYLMTERNGAQRHTLIHCERVLWVVWMPPTPLKPYGVVVTITPPNHSATKRVVSNASQQKLRRLGDRKYRRFWQ